MQKESHDQKSLQAKDKAIIKTQKIPYDKLPSEVLKKVGSGPEYKSALEKKARRVLIELLEND